VVVGSTSAARIVPAVVVTTIAVPSGTGVPITSVILPE
jgi:hypothetical protein